MPVAHIQEHKYRPFAVQCHLQTRNGVMFHGKTGSYRWLSKTSLVYLTDVKHNIRLAVKAVHV